MRAFPHQRKNRGAIRVAAGAIHPIRDHPGGSSEDEHNAESELVPKDRAAARTLDALVFALRKGGIALENPSNRRRLRELSEQQLHEVCKRLQQFIPHMMPPAQGGAPLETTSLSWRDR
jgi:hypothetical protein